MHGARTTAAAFYQPAFRLKLSTSDVLDTRVESLTVTPLAELRMPMRMERGWQQGRSDYGGKHRQQSRQCGRTRQPTFHRKMLVSLRANVIRNGVPSCDNRRSHVALSHAGSNVAMSRVTRQVSKAQTSLPENRKRTKNVVDTCLYTHLPWELNMSGKAHPPELKK